MTCYNGRQGGSPAAIRLTLSPSISITVVWVCHSNESRASNVLLVSFHKLGPKSFLRHPQAVNNPNLIGDSSVVFLIRDCLRPGHKISPLLSVGSLYKKIPLLLALKEILDNL